MRSKRWVENSSSVSRREVVQYTAATPRGWFDGSTFGAFPDAVR